MAQYAGRLQSERLEISVVTVNVDDDDRVRIMAGRRPIGSWPIAKVNAERRSIYKFDLVIDGEAFEFFPDDPSGFGDAVGAVIDLTNDGNRFGLKARIAEASEN
jgi:hypothetical protein